jgi:hypothetical protein
MGWEFRLHAILLRKARGEGMMDRGRVAKREEKGD